LKQLFSNLRQLPRTDKWLLVSVPLILIGIILVVLYGIRQSEIAEQRELFFKQQTAADTERNRLEIEKHAAEAATEIETLKRQAAELSANQSQSSLKDVRIALKVVSQERAEEQRQYEKKLRDLVTSNLDACKRWLKNCAIAQRLGLRAADESCSCR